MRLVLASDTHGLHDQISVPDGDVFIHAGDFTRTGELWEIAAFGTWIENLPHRRKIVIAGNHDFGFERSPGAARAALPPNVDYLQDSGVKIDGVKFFGQPWTPTFFNWAFMLERGAAIAEKWALIPFGTDVVITHGPPLGVLDETVSGEAAGCFDLLERVDFIEPRVHVFGHIHEGHGEKRLGATTFINASVCDLHYRAVNPVRVFDL